MENRFSPLTQPITEEEYKSQSTKPPTPNKCYPNKKLLLQRTNITYIYIRVVYYYVENIGSLERHSTLLQGLEES